MYYLNTTKGADLFREAQRYRNFVDKSLLIRDLYRYSQTENKYIAITRPRRFGKTMAANMLAAFFSREQDTREIFRGLEIAGCKDIFALINGFHVIHIDFLGDLDDVSSYRRFIERLQRKLIRDLCSAFPTLTVTEDDNISTLLTASGERFIFILDEWDAVLEMRFMTDEDREDYIIFLRNVFKNQPYVHFAMMTGILPIAKYSTGSPLNMFREFNAFSRIGFEQYYGFTETEIYGLMERRQSMVPCTGHQQVGHLQQKLASGRRKRFGAGGDSLCPGHDPCAGKTGTPVEETAASVREAGMSAAEFGASAGETVLSPDVSPSMEEIRRWYDGYVRRSDGGHMFNPDSVCNALEEGACRNFWKGTGPMNDISNLISQNAFEVRDDILRMVAGETIEVRLDGFGAEERIPRTRREILSAMVVYGFLTYHEGKLSIPNLELSQKYADLLERGTLGVHMTLEESRTLLEATLARREKEVAARIERIHDEQIPFIAYSDENSLACVIMYAYYGALDWYEIQREEKSGKGYVDFLFVPVDQEHIPIIMELKYNHSAKSAIRQIYDKNYLQRLKKYPEVLLVGINYSERTKKHTCMIERVRNCNLIT